MQLNLFNGGLNTRLQPHLIGASEAVMCHNVDTTSGVLAPLKETKDLQAEVKPNFYKFNNHFVSSDDNRDYVEFQGKLYYSDGTKIPQWSKDGFEWFQLGIDVPKDSLEVYLAGNSAGLNLKPLYGYYEGGDNPSCVSFPSNAVVKKICGINHLYDFESGSISGYYALGSHKKIEFIKNMKSKIFEDGEISKDNFVNGEATLYKSVENTGSSYVPVVCRETGDITVIPDESAIAESLYLRSPFANDTNWYVKTSSDDAFKVKTVRRAGKTIQPTERLSSGYISSVSGDYNNYPDIVTPLYAKPKSEVVFLVKDKNGAIYSILSDVVPDTYEVLHTPTAGGITYFAGFSFEWTFAQTDTVDIFIDGAKIATKQYSDIVRDSRVFVESKCTDREKADKLQPILDKLKEIQYVITYSNGLEESSPSTTVSVPFLSGDTKTVLPYLEIKKSDDPQVTSILLYRRGGGLTQFSLVKEFSNEDTLYQDDISNFDLDGAVLDSYNNTPAPQGLRYLTVSNVMMFGTLNDKLYYTEVAKPYVWDRLNFIDFEEEITGIGDTPNGLLVFTKHKTYIVTGTSPTTFSKYLLSAGVGCILHKSIQTLANTLIWLSAEGLCASNGGAVQILTRDKLNTLRLNTPRCSAVLDDVYYLSHLNGTFIADFRFGLVFREMSGVFLGLCSSDDKLYGVEQGDKLVELFGSENNTTLHYISPNYPDGSMSNIKIYKNIYTYSSGQVELTIRVDDKIVLTQQLDEGFTELKVPAQTKGYFINFEVKGTGTLKEIEYKFEGRQNGR